ncbi:SMP-30/gluconolactonase/LRE family protein [Roseivirga echinicomitans]
MEEKYLHIYYLEFQLNTGIRFFKAILIMMKRYLTLILFLFSGVSFGQETINEYYQTGLAAYESKDYKTYLESMEAIDNMRPNNPTVVHHLARAYALNGRKIRSIQRLNQLLLMDASFDFQENDDFKSIRRNKGYDALVALQAQLTRVEEHDEVFRTIDIGEIHPESFVIMENGDILLGSIRDKKIIRVDPDGGKIDLVKTEYAVLGMHIDPANGLLWAATAAMPEMIDYNLADKGKSLIMQIDPNSGVVIQGLEYNEATTIGDIAIDNHSRIWLSNSLEPTLGRDNTDTTDYTGAFIRKQFDLTNGFFNLQGLALNDDEKYLYLADYITGIHRIDTETDDIVKVFAPEEILLKGIDGLYYYDNTLIAIHNGVKPYRVMQYFLDDTGQHILFGRVINQGGASLGEPTLGQVKDGYFYYLANSPWTAYNDEGEFDLSKVKPIEIRRIKLN